MNVRALSESAPLCSACESDLRQVGGMAVNAGAAVMPWQSPHPAFRNQPPTPSSTEEAALQLVTKDMMRETGKQSVPNNGQPALSLTWQGAELHRIQPGNYRAVCIGWQGPEHVRNFNRWSLRLEFSLLDDGTLLSAFFNFGNQSRPQIPKQRSRFYRAWCLANGEQPRKGQQLSFETFTEPGLIYIVRVEDCLKDSKGEAKPDALVYSRVTEILEVLRK